MKKPFLHANYDTGEGYVSEPKEWKSMDALLKADLLKDWMYDIEKLYYQAVNEAFHKKTTKIGKNK